MIKNLLYFLCFQIGVIIMNQINKIILLTVLGTLAAAPQPPQDGAQPLTEQAAACDAKGCPQKDQNGQAPTSCSHEYGIATGFRCILLCTYPNAQWGTIVASSDCD